MNIHDRGQFIKEKILWTNKIAKQPQRERDRKKYLIGSNVDFIHA